MTFTNLSSFRVACDWDQPHLCDAGVVIHATDHDDVFEQLRARDWRVDIVESYKMAKTYCPEAKRFAPKPNK